MQDSHTTSRSTDADNPTIPTGLDVDHRADEGRDVCLPPERREHTDYEQPRWASAHLADVDRVFATASRSGSNAITDGDDPQIRIDLDAVGSGGASLHENGENVTVSVWLSPTRIEDLLTQIRRAKELGRNEVWRDDWGDEE
jgi:hypothetical protein